MNKERRTTLLALVTGAAAGLAIVAARRGVKGADKLAARLGRPMAPKAEAKTYGYKEINLS
ncbi:MAG TPA: hypothetical protein VNT75_01000 [Symbiobacteriaceae bacterium]|nr:hypothetical protein [Symbiobacteriaceae bacterium]